MGEFSQDPWFPWGPPWHTSLMISLLLGSVLIYNMPLVLQTWQIHHSGAPRGPKAAFKGPGGPLTYQSYDKMCCNEFLCHRDWFWYITCQQTLKLDKFTFQGPPRGLKAPFKGPGGPLTYQSYDKMCCNEFLCHRDWFWYITCQQSFKLDIFTFQGPPRSPKAPFKSLSMWQAIFLQFFLSDDNY